EELTFLVVWHLMSNIRVGRNGPTDCQALTPKLPSQSNQPVDQRVRFVEVDSQQSQPEQDGRSFEKSIGRRAGGREQKVVLGIELCRGGSQHGQPIRPLVDRS